MRIFALITYQRVKESLSLIPSTPLPQKPPNLPTLGAWKLTKGQMDKDKLPRRIVSTIYFREIGKISLENLHSIQAEIDPFLASLQCVK